MVFPYKASLMLLVLVSQLCPAVLAMRASTAEMAEDMQSKTLAMESGMVIDGKYKLQRRWEGPGSQQPDSEGFYSVTKENEDVFQTAKAEEADVFQTANGPDSNGDVFETARSKSFDFGMFDKPGREPAARDQKPEIPGMAMKKLMGAGTFGEAWIATDATTGEEVVLKFLVNRDKDTDAKEYITTAAREAAQEFDPVSILVHSAEIECDTPQAVLAQEDLYLAGAKHICKCRDSSLNNPENPTQPLYIVQDICGVDSFANLLTAPGKHPEITGRQDWELVVVHGVLQGLSLMAKAGFVHHDLKPGNIVVDAQGSAKIIDFGGAVKRHHPANYVTMCTPVFKPPEAECSKVKGGVPLFAEPLSSFDSYSLGITLFFVLCKGETTTDFKHYANARECLKGGPSDEHSMKALELARQLVAWKPEDRPDPADAAAQLWSIINM